MLVELRVRELGVIDDVQIVFSSGLTAITGETGTGKTLVVEALELLVGGRADPTMVRDGAAESIVEGRFSEDERELVLSRVIPREGRSRSFVDGRMAQTAALEEAGGGLVDLYGQHAHQSLLRPAAQRSALDRFAGVDLAPVGALRREAGALEEELASLGGDARQRQRQLDLLRFERDEIDKAAIAGADEDEELAHEEERLRQASALRQSVETAYEVLEGDEGGALVRLGVALDSLGRFDLLAERATRLRGLVAELADLTSELRADAERFEENPERLEEIRLRRQLLHDLVRKHGEALADVLAARARLEGEISALESADERRREVEGELAAKRNELAAAERLVGDLRRKSAPVLSGAVGRHLQRLGMKKARLEVAVGDEPFGETVEFLLAANPGEPALPLAKIASGGELARSMLALRLVLTSAPATLVFDEVDAGIGGEAALAVGAALAELAAAHQVLVVTHLAQVAAYADQQLAVEKFARAGRTLARVRPVSGEERVVELSRMLSGHPDSKTAREHAAELLEKVGARTGR